VRRLRVCFLGLLFYYFSSPGPFRRTTVPDVFRKHGLILRKAGLLPRLITLNISHLLKRRSSDHIRTFVHDIVRIWLFYFQLLLLPGFFKLKNGAINHCMPFHQASYPKVSRLRQYLNLPQMATAVQITEGHFRFKDGSLAYQKTWTVILSYS
jgi:hypothetical protein